MVAARILYNYKCYQVIIIQNIKLMTDYREKLNDLLLATARQGASDLHLAVGRRPTLRIDGVLMPLHQEPVLTPEIAEGLVLALLTPEQKEMFRRDKQLDLWFA